MRVGKSSVFALLVVALLLGAVVPAAQAQDSGIVISLSVPEFMQDVFSDEILARFQAQNPGVTVNVVSNMPFFQSPAGDVNGYLDDIKDYVSSADVVYVSAESLAPEATRAGYILDLAPLANGDPTLNTSDFIPPVWQSFQWDNGVWALPVSTDVAILVYDMDAFDAAGLAYPNEGWTMDDLANAARTLATRGPQGDVTVPGFGMFSPYLGVLFRSLIGEGLYDPNTLPNAPQFTKPGLDALLTTWAELVNEGLATNQPGENYQDVPMRIGGRNELFMRPGEDQRTGYALLPGGHAGLNAQGFAVSGGTQYPEQAYALAKFLTNDAQSANSFFGAVPARQSLAGAQVTGEGRRFVGPALSPEAQAFIEQAVANGLPMSEYRYSDYLTNAASNVINDGVDPLTALQTVEANAIANLQTAEARKGTDIVAVATPVPTPVLQAGEVALNYSMVSFMIPFPNRDQWDQAIQDFVASDPQVGQIIFEAERQDVSELVQTADCFYVPYNAVPDLDLNTVLNLDPYMDADASFSRADVVGNTLAQLQRDNKTWAFPVNIQPQVMNYDPEQFAAAGVPNPEGGWTVDQFADALQALKVNTGDNPPFNPRDIGGTQLLMLIAAYGGLPLDYRTNPPTINFTDPATLSAIQQVLDMAKNGLINYQELGQLNRAFFVGGGDGENQPPLTTRTLGGPGINIEIGGNGRSTYQMTSFPAGSQYTPVSYDIGTMYISATSQNPDACYRWMSYVSQHPELFSSMPARRSQINDPATVASQGADAVAAYNQFDALMQSPNTVVFPTPFSGGSPLNLLVRTWLNRAFDNYVLHDGNLQTDLEDAQVMATAFQECSNAIPPYDPASQTRQDYFRSYIDCATSADPTLTGLFGQ
jgi:ABC-type glycerol-3-phosphate transport system substrate-binding protein